MNSTFSLRSGLLGDCLNGANQASRQSQQMHHSNDYGAPKSKNNKYRFKHSDSSLTETDRAVGLSVRSRT